MLQFSFLRRQETLAKLDETSYDLLIIGGGITGAGIALDAASRGLKTLLVEKNDFAYGTSSRSTKLIHGGLRYLKQFEFGLVKEVGSERAVVHNLAPHLVVPEKMLLPLSEKKGLGYWLTSIGLKIYDWLAAVKSEDRRRMLTRSQTLRSEPLLRRDDVKGGAIYAEYRTDDARLTVEIVKTAARHGADILNYTRVTDFVYTDGKVSGAYITDHEKGGTFQVRATTVVNATGPWVDELREINHSKQGKRLHLTKGVHIVVSHKRFPVKQAIYFDVDDGRMIFAIPRGRTTYIGTTDTNYTGDKETVVATPEDAAYLIKAVNTTFPATNLTVDDIESSWAGLRPLIHEEGKSASELSRKDEIFESSTGLISIAGGKLTGYRKMAERVLDLVIRKYFADRTLSPCKTHTIKLAGDGFAGLEEVRHFNNSLNHQLATLKLPSQDARYLLETYGKQAVEVLTMTVTTPQISDQEERLLRAEAEFAMKHEMAMTLSDFFVRRTGLLYFDIGKVKRWKGVIAQEMKKYLGWDTERMQREIDDIDHLIQLATAFR